MIEILKDIDLKLQKEFENSQIILTFQEYLELLATNPEKQIRASAQYMVDMLDYFGREDYVPLGKSETLYRFKLFDQPINGYASQVVGLESVQTRIYQSLKSFARQGFNNRLILLHGPNGSAKSTLVHSLMSGMERYAQTQEGAVYTFNWIFPLEKSSKAGIGIQTYSHSSQESDSFAKLPEDQIAARIPSETKDHPILLIPSQERENLLIKLLGEEKAKKIWKKVPEYLKSGDLSHRCRQIYDALLTTYQGDYEKVLKHIQVNRFFYSKRYRKGLSTVEPQMHVDANYNLLTFNRSINMLPSALQSMNFFTVGGNLVDGNRGVVEYSDLLKRPIDTFKYLLTACETGSVSVGNTNLYIDTVMLGSSNEIQLDAFKEFPDFNSFKARIQLIRVPYLLDISREKLIYNQLLNQYPSDKHTAPHVPWTLASWAVLTRLKKPNSINYPPTVSAIISKLTPIEKAKLYDNGKMPEYLNPEERQLLKSHLGKIKDEYNNIPYYEGRMGASARELKSILHDAIQNQDFKCISPLSVIKEIERFIKRVSEYDFLKQEVKDGYHDVPSFVAVVKREYLDRIDYEVRSSMGLYDVDQWESFIQKYVLHISHFLKKEKIPNPVTGKGDEADQNLIQEFEKIVDAPKEGKTLEKFRQNVISRIGAWSLDHKNQKVVYSEIFPEYWSKIEKHYYDSQKGLLQNMNNALQHHGTDKVDNQSDDYKLAIQTLENLKKSYSYCDNCAKEVVGFLMKERY